MNNTSKNELLIVIIENIHLASPDEIQQIKLIIKKYESISILITRRKNTLQSASGEDILEPLQNNDIGEQINLEEVIDYKSLIETLVSKLMDHYLNLVSNKPKESVKSIFHDSNETNFLLQLLRIQALLEYSIPDLKTANGLKMSPLTSKEQYKIVEKLELIKSNDYEGIIDNILIEHFQSNIQSLSSSHISRYMLEKILFFCYALSSLEIPIEEELLAKLLSFQQDDLRKIFL